MTCRSCDEDKSDGAVSMEISTVTALASFVEDFVITTEPVLAPVMNRSRRGNYDQPVGWVKATG